MYRRLNLLALWKALKKRDKQLQLPKGTAVKDFERITAFFNQQIRIPPKTKVRRALQEQNNCCFCSFSVFGRFGHLYLLFRQSLYTAICGYGCITSCLCFIFFASAGIPWLVALRVLVFSLSGASFVAPVLVVSLRFSVCLVPFHQSLCDNSCNLCCCLSCLASPFLPLPPALSGFFLQYVARIPFP